MWRIEYYRPFTISTTGMIEYYGSILGFDDALKLWVNEFNNDRIFVRSVTNSSFILVTDKKDFFYFDGRKLYNLLYDDNDELFFLRENLRNIIDNINVNEYQFAGRELLRSEPFKAKVDVTIPKNDSIKIISSELVINPYYNIKYVDMRILINTEKGFIIKIHPNHVDEVLKLILNNNEIKRTNIGYIIGDKFVNLYISDEPILFSQIYDYNNVYIGRSVIYYKGEFFPKRIINYISWNPILNYEKIMATQKNLEMEEYDAIIDYLYKNIKRPLNDLTKYKFSKKIILEVLE